MRREIEDGFDRCRGIYGLSEVRPGVANECVETKDLAW
jgi:hypothetical protein